MEKTFERPAPERLMRNLLATVMPRPGLFRHLMSAAWLAKPFAPLLERLGMKRVAAALALTPTHLPREMTGRPGFYPAEGKEKAAPCCCAAACSR